VSFMTVYGRDNESRNTALQGVGGLYLFNLCWLRIVLRKREDRARIKRVAMVVRVNGGTSLRAPATTSVINRLRSKFDQGPASLTACGALFFYFLGMIEAIFLHLAAVQLGNLLALIFGNPSSLLVRRHTDTVTPHLNRRDWVALPLRHGPSSAKSPPPHCPARFLRYPSGRGCRRR